MSGATGNQVQGNFIGTDVTGTASIPNANGGLAVCAPGNTIGGPTPAARNLISGNIGHAVQLCGPTATGNVVQGNFIGTDVTGMLDLGNSFFGVLISQAPGNTIGGTEGTTPGGAC